MKKTQQGASLLIVLIMLTVLALAALSLARATFTSTTVAGNLSYKVAAMQASDAGLSEAFAQLQTLSTTDLQANKGNWYFAALQPADSAGLPTGVDWTNTSKVSVGTGYSVAYVVERMCAAAGAPDPNSCFVKRAAANGSAKAGSEAMDAPPAVQYRITAYVQGPKGTETYVQALAVRGS